MKVEFIESEFWGPALFVAEIDFRQAKSNNIEFDSLAHAVTAFANLFEIDFTIEREVYDTALAELEKTDQ